MLSEVRDENDISGRYALPDWHEIAVLCRRITSVVPHLILPDHRITLLSLSPYYKPAGWQFEPHSHSYYEANIILSGHACARAQSLAPMHTILHAPLDTHTWGAPEDSCRGLLFGFFVEPPISVTLAPIWVVMPAIMKEVCQLFTDVSGYRPGWRDLAAARIGLIIAHILTLGQLPESRYEDIENTARFVNMVERFLHDNFARPLGLDDIAGAIGVSLSTLTHRYVAATGTPVLRRLIALRMEQATLRLTHTDLPLARISDEVGIANAAYLCRLFRRTTGMSPIAYRKQFQGIANHGDPDQ